MEHEPILWVHLIPKINTLPVHTVHATVVALLLVLFAWLAKRQLAAVHSTGAELLPDDRLTVRMVAELFVEGMVSLTEGVLGSRGHSYLSLFGSFFLFILAANLMGLLPGFAPPTNNFNITFGLGVASFLAYNAIGIHSQGLLRYLKHFVGPIWWLGVLMVPLELIDNLVRPFSLALRLFGNMTGDHLVLEIFTDLTKLLVPVVFYFLGAFVSLIQAFVFTLLTVIYVQLALGHEDHGQP